MVEIISSILEAEAKAEQLVKEANEKSKKIILDADVKSENIFNSAIALSKLHSKNSDNEANKQAQEEYDAIVKSGTEDAKRVAFSAERNVEKASDFILERVLD